MRQGRFCRCFARRHDLINTPEALIVILPPVGSGRALLIRVLGRLPAAPHCSAGVPFSPTPKRLHSSSNTWGSFLSLVPVVCFILDQCRADTSPHDKLPSPTKSDSSTPVAWTPTTYGRDKSVWGRVCSCCQRQRTTQSTKRLTSRGHCWGQGTSIFDSERSLSRRCHESLVEVENIDEKAHRYIPKYKACAP